MHSVLHFLTIHPIIIENFKTYYSEFMNYLYHQTINILNRHFFRKKIKILYFYKTGNMTESRFLYFGLIVLLFDRDFLFYFILF